VPTKEPKKINPAMKVVITGMGIQCSLGSSVKELWDGIRQGNSGIRHINRFDVSAFEPKLGGMIPEGDQIESDEERLLSYARSAAKEAWNHSGITDLSGVSLVLGTSNGVRGRKINEISYQLAQELNILGQVITVSTACASSSHAIGFAAGLLQRGTAKVVIAGGVDILTLDVFAGFHCLGLLSKNACSPFSHPLGTTLGEGAAFLVMETEENAQERGVLPLAVFMGSGMAADAFHDTRPDPSGSGIFRAISAALQNSNLEPGHIDYINAHGTGTAANDSAEWRGIQDALSNHSVNIPISSSKSFLGHGQGASGAMEAITTIVSMLHNVIPPTLNHTRPRPFSPADPVAENRPRPYLSKYALCTNSGFGGLNTALVFGRYNPDNILPEKNPRSIAILGYGINMDQDYISNFVPYDELRSTDLMAKLLAGVVAMILNNAGITFRSNECESMGLFVAQDHISEDSLEALDASILERGIKHLSASAFTRLVVNYPAGVCCRLFGIKGPVAVTASRPDSGLTTLCLAADHLAWREDTDLMIVAAVDPYNAQTGKPARAVGVLLKAGDEKSAVRLIKWSLLPGAYTSNKETINTQGDFTGLPAVNPDLGDLINAIKDISNTPRDSVCIQTAQNAPYPGVEIIIEKGELVCKPN
jgi:3-oxoacyl-[acyl-carrier-protein] synthase II